jgi:hypothetical protein
MADFEDKTKNNQTNGSDGTSGEQNGARNDVVVKIGLVGDAQVIIIIVMKFYSTLFVGRENNFNG